MEKERIDRFLEKFRESETIFDDLGKELAEMSSSYESQLDTLQKKLIEAERKTKEASVREVEATEKFSEIEHRLEQLKKFQEEDYRPLVKELFEKPKGELQHELKASTKKSVLISISAAVLSIFAGVVVSIYLNSEGAAIVNKTQSEVIKNIGKLAKTVDDLTVLLDSQAESQQRKLIEQFSIIENYTSSSIEEIQKSTQLIEAIASKTEIISESFQSLSNDEKVEKIVTSLASFSKEHGIDGKNQMRLFYKMEALNYVPFEHDIFLKALRRFPREIYSPSHSDLKVWDQQMLSINKAMERSISNYRSKKIPNSLRRFGKYKLNDATQYGGWLYNTDDKSLLLSAIKSNIISISKHIEVNRKFNNKTKK